MKKILAITISIIMMLTLVGCGADSTQGTAKPAETTPATEVTSPSIETPETLTPDTTETETTENNVGTDTAGDTDTAETLGNQLAAIFQKGVEAGTDLESLADQLGQAADMDCAVDPVKEGYLNGLTGDVTGFSKGYKFAPMISSIAFMGYVFETEDPEGLKTVLLDKADPRWNICTEAEETVCVTSGNYVFFVMCPGEDW